MCVCFDMHIRYAYVRLCYVDDEKCIFRFEKLVGVSSVRVFFGVSKKGKFCLRLFPNKELF